MDFGLIDITMRKAARISECGRYRYTLGRSWGRGRGMLLWVMLNPSTADANADDPTIRRCVDFSKRWGYAEMVVVNLFAYRSSNPGALTGVCGGAVGADNDRTIIEVGLRARDTVAAWGNHGGLMGRDLAVLPDLESPKCLGVTKGGFPCHPLYVPRDTKLIPYCGR